MQQIPKVDLNDFLSANQNDKKQFVAQLGSAFEEIGFVALRGHFLSSKLMEDLYNHFQEDMPYGTQKARDGDPDEFIYDALQDMTLPLGKVTRL